MQLERDILNPSFVRSVKRYLDKINNNPNISKINKQHIESFITFCESRGLSKARMNFYLERLRPFSEFAEKKDFKSLTRFDFDSFLAERSNRLSSWGLDAFICTFFVFYRHLFGLTSQDRVPEPLRHLKRTKGKTSIRKKDLFTHEELEKMITSTRSLYGKVAIETLIETAVRPGEFRSLKTSDVTMDSESITLHVSGGKMAEKAEERDVFILNPGYVKDFKIWFKRHPNRSNGSWLFYDKVPEKPITYWRLSAIIKRAAKKSNINNRAIKLYLFRHSALHEAYKKFPTEAVRRMAGHSETSGMPAVYCHADSDDLKQMLMEGRGLQKEISEKELIDLLLKFEKRPGGLFKVLKERAKELEGAK